MLSWFGTAQSERHGLVQRAGGSLFTSTLSLHCQYSHLRKAFATICRKVTDQLGLHDTTSHIHAEHRIVPNSSSSLPSTDKNKNTHRFRITSQHRPATMDRQRDLVFCHECENEWFRDEGGLTCPDCRSDFTEIVSRASINRSFHRRLLLTRPLDRGTA